MQPLSVRVALEWITWKRFDEAATRTSTQQVDHIARPAPMVFMDDGE